MSKEIEKRVFNSELRAEGGEESRKVIGYAAVFGKDSHDLGGFIERVDKRAFNEVLSDDAVALLNHDQNFVLARNGVTMSLSVDDKGLRYEFEAPNTTAGNDLIENIRLGNINQSSFAFTVEDDTWEERDGKPHLRTINKVKRLFDVSPVTYPAYPDTTVAQRSLNAFNEDNNEIAITHNTKIKQLKTKNRRRR